MTRDDIIRMAREAGLPYMYQTGEVANLGLVERFAALVAAAEREACAEVCEQMRVGVDAFGSIDYHVELTRDMCADAIRARGQQ